MKEYGFSARVDNVNAREVLANTRKKIQHNIKGKNGNITQKERDKIIREALRGK